MLKKVAFLLIISTIILSCTSSSSPSQGWVVTSPELAEIIAKLDAAENIVGVTKECDFPPELQNKTLVGTFGHVDLEKIVRLQPQKIFITALEQDNLRSQLEKLQIPAVAAYPQNIPQLLDTIIKIGNEIDKPWAAQNLRSRLEQQLQQLQARKFALTPRVYIEIYGQPLMTVSDSSFVGQLLQAAGGQNIFPTLPRDYSRISPEKVIAANPEVIIITYPGITKKQVADRKGWQNVSAVQNGRIYTVQDIDPDIILRASPRFVQGIEKLQDIIHE